MYTKIQITGDIEVKTGLHIGGSNAYAAIGAVDQPVVRDAGSNRPMIPGSSLKGKMRSLLAKEYNTETVAKKPEDDAQCLLRLFGSAQKDHVKRSRVLIADMFPRNEEELRRMGLQGLTEVKFENAINRATAVANPRQIERVIRGTRFGLDIIYEVEMEEEFLEDMRILAEGFKLVQYDYLGGNGSRGYGKVLFRELEARTVVGDIGEELLEECNAILRSVAG